MILWSPIEFTTLAYTLVRQYLDYTVVGWWDMSAISTGQTLVLQETPFGGYRFHLKYKDWFWDNRAGTGAFLDVVEDLYVTAPGSSTPISAGAVIFEVKQDPRTKSYVIVLANYPNDGHYAFNRFPPNPVGYWYQNHVPRAESFFIDFTG